MGDIRRECLRECSTMILDPSFDFVVLVGRKVVRMTEDDVAERLVLAHVDGGSEVKTEFAGIVSEHREAQLIKV